MGGVIGGIGYEALGIGSFKEGFRAGAIVGSIAGGLNYGYHAQAFFDTASTDINTRIIGYVVKFLGIVEPLHFIPTAWSCDNLSGSISNSGILGECND